LLYALLSQKSADFFNQTPRSNVLSIELLQPQKTALSVPNTLSEPALVQSSDTSVLALDSSSGKIFFDKESSVARPVASLTKLMTALLILEQHDLNEVVTVDPLANKTAGSSVGLFAYEKISVKTLLEAILIGSANDGAVALAIHNAGSEKEFVTKMNAKAQDLELFSAQFHNATGLDVFDPSTRSFRGNEMSAADVSRLARIIWRNEFVRNTVQKQEFLGTSIDGEFTHQKDTTNELLGTDLNLKGLKTGYTKLARQCFVAIGENQAGHEVLTVMLGSDDRFGQTAELLEWVYNTFQWR